MARSLLGFSGLSAAIRVGRLAGAKGTPVYDLDELSAAAREGQWAILTGCPTTGTAAYNARALDERLGLTGYWCCGG
ncbi:hypothetical protein ACQEVY_05620 [Streptomyces sp. CA-288835]|uniref:hypothetical protein n=1 Tax=Streptomyces sp. CA-288835 TaxID=3240069 RepID=UPI003D8E57AD